MLDIDFWKKYFKTYDILNIVIPYKKLLQSLIEALDIKEGDKVLDAGAGTGNLSIILKELGAEVIALDSSKEGLEVLKRKDADIKTVVQSLGGALDFRDNSFEKIVSNNVIYAIDPKERKKVFAEFYRIVKPGGKIVVSNVKEGWKPLNIYKAHINEEIKEIGFLKMILKMFKLAIPTIKMFYYNGKIKKENKDGDYSFMKDNDQKNLLKEAGFANISENQSTYADQAIMNTATKPA